MLLILIPMVPLFGALALYFVRDRFKRFPLIIYGFTLVLACVLLKNTLTGPPQTLRLSLKGPFEPVFYADPLSAGLVVLSAFLWFVVGIYSPKYMEHEGRGTQFNTFTLITLFSVLGVFLGGNMFTLLFFFEIMSVISYFWVIHRRDGTAFKSGYYYLFFSIIGGLLIVLGIVILGGDLDMARVFGTQFAPLSESLMHTWGIALLVLGFGIKAGIAPVHVWLPHAHSAAPTPASALLSGLLIKVGAYGLIRTVGFAGGWGIQLQSTLGHLGPILIVLALCTMLAGAVGALLQRNVKKLLAYSSISQMGYIVFGLGTAVYLGKGGGLGLAGAFYHMLNHGLFKTALFLGAGIVYIYTDETDLYEMGGLWRKLPLTALLMLVAIMGVTGVPGLNGYASKTLLHHGISGASSMGGPGMVWAERLFTLTGVGTAAYFSKLYYLMFLRRPKGERVKGIKPQFSGFHLALLLLVIPIIIIGMRPSLLPDFIVGPAIESLGMVESMGVSFWNGRDILSMGITLMAGVLVCGAGLKTGALGWEPPLWLTVEGLAVIMLRGVSRLGQALLQLYRTGVKGFSRGAVRLKDFLLSFVYWFDKTKNWSFGKNFISGVSADATLLILIFALLVTGYTIFGPGAIKSCMEHLIASLTGMGF